MSKKKLSFKELSERMTFSKLTKMVQVSLDGETWVDLNSREGQDLEDHGIVFQDKVLYRKKEEDEEE